MGKGIKRSNLYFSLFVVFLTILIIYNKYRAEDLIVTKNKLQNETDILHSKYTKSITNVMSSATERKIAQDTLIKARGLKLPERPLPEIVLKSYNEHE